MTSNTQGHSELADVGAFGAVLRRHRRNLDLSQDDLADATHGGVATRTISDLERGVARRPRGSSRSPRWTRARTDGACPPRQALTGPDNSNKRVAQRGADIREKAEKR